MIMPRTIAVVSVMCMALSACVQMQKHESADAAVPPTAQPVTHSSPAVSPGTLTAPQKPSKSQSQNAASAKSKARKPAAASEIYPAASTGETCPDYAKATIIKKKLSKESSDRYLFDARLKMTGRVEEIAAWGYKLDATKLKVGDRVCLK